MYYDSKSTFYFRQYGVPALIVTFLIVIVGSGLFIYWSSSTKNTSKDKMILASDSLKDTTKNEQATLTEELANLKSLVKSPEGTITEVKNDGSMILNLSEKQIPIFLIGIDSATVSNQYIATLTSDLIGKAVTIAFDQEKLINGNISCYVYLGESLYNSTILEHGLAKLKDDQQNYALLNDLKQAQAYAKQLSKGVWNTK